MSQDSTRRDILRAGTVGLGSLFLPDLLRLEAAMHDAKPAHSGRAKSVIMLFLSGGPSQLDMWDLKPEAPQEIRGTFRPLPTNVPGISISEHLPRMAVVADKFVLVRSVNHSTGNHPAASYWMMTGSPIGRPAPQNITMSREDRPHPGSVIARFLPTQQCMPAFVMMPEAISPVGPERPGQHAGFLGARYDPYRVNSDPNLPDYCAGALELGRELSGKRLQDRHVLLDIITRQARELDKAVAAQSLDPYMVRAFDLVSSPAAQQAFDIAAEPSKVRDRYGRHEFGQCALLARRLIEAGVRLVHVNWVRHDNAKGGQGYDSHRDHLQWCKSELLPPTDAAIASLLEDLADRGLLEETLVIVMGEFGRTPRFNANGGRDHWPSCFSVMLAGGGMRGGQLYGASDKIAAYPTADPVTPQDLSATLYHCLGINPHMVLNDSLNRPYTLAEGTPLCSLM